MKKTTVEKSITAVFSTALCAGLLFAGSLQAAGSRTEQTEQTELAAETETEDSSYSSDSFGNLQDFKAKALDGKEYTEKDFKDKDLIMVNFWSTQCGPCIYEMPGLAKLEQSLPDNVKMITVCLDGAGYEDIVKQILDEAGYTGTTFVSWGSGDDLDVIAQELQYTPTTLFFDAKGKITGKEQIGSFEDPESEYKELINTVLKDMGKDEI